MASNPVPDVASSVLRMISALFEMTAMSRPFSMSAADDEASTSGPAKNAELTWAELKASYGYDDCKQLPYLVHLT